MLYSFDEMPDTSRMWIYQSDRPFTEAEILAIEQEARVFVDSWAAHGQKLKAAYKIEHKQFLLLAVDESFNEASGCSIDESVGFIKNLEQTLGLQLLNRSNVAFYIDGEVVVEPLKDLKSRIDEGQIKKDTLIFNGFINKLEDFRNAWTQPAEESWMARYFR
ncbi:MAG: hypothetical protein ACFHWX_21460 [Bacteroidota bacterium]